MYKGKVHLHFRKEEVNLAIFHRSFLKRDIVILVFRIPCAPLDFVECDEI